MSQSVLLKLARNAIEEVMLGENLIDKEALIKEFPGLKEPIASFVTLNLNGELRGCIGSLIAKRSLIDDIIANARAAAFNDPRFSPLSVSEYLSCDIELSLLSPPEQISYNSAEELKQQITPKKDGIIMAKDDSQATFLPQVWDEYPTFEGFFAELGQKAGLGRDPLTHQPDIYRYHVEKARDKPKISKQNVSKVNKKKIQAYGG